MSLTEFADWIIGAVVAACLFYAIGVGLPSIVLSMCMTIGFVAFLWWIGRKRA